VLEVGGAGVVLEWCVVLNVIGVGGVVALCSGGIAVASVAAVGVGLGGQVEAALKPSPGDILGIQQIADILAGHGDFNGAGGADIADRIRVAHQGKAAVAVRNGRSGAVGAGVGRARRAGSGLYAGGAGIRLSVCDSPFVWPEIRLMAPGVEGPNCDVYALSFMAKLCA